tara:strand:+ start:129 stop:365 length:237 start_codon:yes stop_codon:yes gene_type:complete
MTETNNLKHMCKNRILCNWCGEDYTYEYEDDWDMINKHLEKGLCEGILPETNELLKKGISWEEAHKITGNKQFPWMNK